MYQIHMHLYKQGDKVKKYAKNKRKGKRQVGRELQRLCKVLPKKNVVICKTRSTNVSAMLAYEATVSFSRYYIGNKGRR